MLIETLSRVGAGWAGEDMPPEHDPFGHHCILQVEPKNLGRLLDRLSRADCTVGDRRRHVLSVSGDVAAGRPYASAHARSDLSTIHVVCAWRKAWVVVRAEMAARTTRHRRLSAESGYRMDPFRDIDGRITVRGRGSFCGANTT